MLFCRDLHALYAEKVALFLPGGKYAGGTQTANAAAVADALKFYLDSKDKVLYCCTLLFYFMLPVL